MIGPPGEPATLLRTYQEVTRTMDTFRRLVAVVLGLFGLVMGYDALTLPYVAATTPALLAIAAVVGVCFLWPKRQPMTDAEVELANSASAVYAEVSREALDTGPYIECPHCGTYTHKVHATCVKCGKPV